MSEIDFDQLSIDILTTQNTITHQLEPNPGMPRVIMMGLTGSGKSSLMNCLSGREIRIVEGRGRRIELIGEGIQSGSESFTRRPEIYLDESSGIIYCDCPGFEDSGGIKQEILNSYAIDQLLQNINERQCLIKILFIISAYEIESGRSQIILRNIERIERILTNEEEMRSGVGIVITKGDEEITGIDYLERIKENANDKLRRFCDYYIEHQEHLFTFPKAPRSRIGEEYNDFPDRTRLNEFLQTHQIINPRHEVGLSENSLLALEQLGHAQIVKANETADRLFERITDEYYQNDDEVHIMQWLNLMQQLVQADINNANDFIVIIQAHNLNNDNFAESFTQLRNYENINEFIGNALHNDDIKYCIRNSIRSKLDATIRELQNFLQHHQVVRDQQSQIDQQNQDLLARNELIQNQKEEIGFQKKLNFLFGFAGFGIIGTKIYPTVVELASKPEVWQKIGEIVAIALNGNK